AFARFSPLDIVHFDAHMDWRDEIGGVKFANASPLRRSKELPFVRNMVQLGIRDVRTSDDQIADAEAAGALVVTREQIREEGVKGVLDRLPPLGNTFVTIDIDGLDPSIAPGTGSPTVDGLLYHEVRALLQGVAKRGKGGGFDLVEVNPMVDPHGRTCLLASTLTLEFLGAIFASRGVVKCPSQSSVKGSSKMRRLLVVLAAAPFAVVAGAAALAQGTLRVGAPSNANPLHPAKTKIGEEYIINFLVFSGL